MNDEQVRGIKKMYPSGTKIKLVYMNDKQAVPSGTIGTVDYVDDIGTIFMKWDNGSTLGLIYGVDKFEKVKEGEKRYEPESILY